MTRESIERSQELLESFARSYGLPVSVGYFPPSHAQAINYNERTIQFTDDSFSMCGIYDQGKIVAVVEFLKNFCTCNQHDCDHRQDAIGAAFTLIQAHQKFNAAEWDRRRVEAAIDSGKGLL
ncbi:MAG TPA: hypothetical protein VF747_06585 [Blastocatellia bacterium]|jgi:hypothetical protein